MPAFPSEQLLAKESVALDDTDGVIGRSEIVGDGKADDSATND
jgi:hypothetical protein